MKLHVIHPPSAHHNFLDHTHAYFQFSRAIYTESAMLKIIPRKENKSKKEKGRVVEEERN